MKKLFYLFLITFLLTANIFAQDGVDIWTTTTTSVGRVYGMVIDPSNQDIMYSVGLDFGVYKTTDGGTTWATANSGLTLAQVQAVAISKNNPNVLYVGTPGGNANSGVYKTTDGGGNWTKVNTGITESSIAVQAVMVHPDNPDIAWVAIFDGLADAVNGIYKTTNGGTSWAPAVTGIGTVKNFLSFGMSTTDPNTIYAGSSFLVATSTGPSKIYKSINGGDLWTEATIGLPTDPTDINPIRVIKVSDADPNLLLAGLFMNTVNGGVYISTDAGASWTRKFNGAPQDVGTLIRSAAIRPGSTTEFVVGLDRSTGVNIGVWGTTDGGTNWASASGGTMLSTYAIRALVFNSTGTHTLFAGCASPIGSGAGIYEYTFSIIPVELVSFTADVIGNTINLDWVTATEMNNQGFEIQRTSSSSENWEVVGFIAGFGTSTELHHYSFTDEPTASGKYQYRLKQIDYDGSFTLTDFVEVEVIISKDYNLSQNYPNPFNPATLISFSIPNDEFVTLKIYDVLGSEIAQIINERRSAGTYQVEFNASSLNTGVYYYTLTAGSYTETKKMMLMK